MPPPPARFSKRGGRNGRWRYTPPFRNAMQVWFTNLTDKLLALPPITYVLLGLIALSGILFWVLFAKKAKKSVTICFVCALFVALIATVALTLPAITPEEGTTQAAAFLYAPMFWAVLTGAAGAVALLLLLRKQVWTVRMLSTGALCTALSFVLSCITLWRMQNGGSITPASMLPILVFAWIYGPIPGTAAGTLYGLIQLVQGAYVVHPMQFLLDYIFPFAVLGICGLFKRDKQLPYGIVTACACRYLVHFLSGVIFFGMYAPEGQSAFVYSLLYNASYMVPETILCLVIACIPRVRHALVQLRHEVQGA